MISSKELAEATIDEVLRPRILDFVESLSNPNNYLCRVLEYQQHRSRLVIRIFNVTTDEKFEMIFQSVEYFEGAMIWIGAQFSVATFDDSIDLLSRIAMNRNATAEDFLYQGCLFIVGKSEQPIARILAWNITMTKINEDR